MIRFFPLIVDLLMNLLILFKNKPIGTINILHNENHYTKNDIKKIEHLTIYLIPFLLNSSTKNEK